jgi:hypothetical protein
MLIIFAHSDVETDGEKKEKSDQGHQHGHSHNNNNNDKQGHGHSHNVMPSEDTFQVTKTNLIKKLVSK